MPQKYSRPDTTVKIRITVMISTSVCAWLSTSRASKTPPNSPSPQLARHPGTRPRRAESSTGTSAPAAIAPRIQALTLSSGNNHTSSNRPAPAIWTVVLSFATHEVRKPKCSSNAMLRSTVTASSRTNTSETNSVDTIWRSATGRYAAARKILSTIGSSSAPSGVLP